LSLKTINHYTYDKVVFDINYKLLKDFSPSAFKKKCNILKNGDITYLNNQLLKNIYSDKNERRVIAVDGSYLKTLKKLDKDGLKYQVKNIIIIQIVLLAKFMMLIKKLLSIIIILLIRTKEMLLLNN